VAKYLAAGSGAAISKQMGRYKKLLSTDKKLVKLLEKAEQLLDKRRDKHRKVLNQGLIPL